MTNIWLLYYAASELSITLNRIPNPTVFRTFIYFHIESIRCSKIIFVMLFDYSSRLFSPLLLLMHTVTQLCGPCAHKLNAVDVCIFQCQDKILNVYGRPLECMFNTILPLFSYKPLVCATVSIAYQFHRH